MSSPVSTHRDGDVLIITCDSPPVNAISAAIRSGLLSITRSLATNRDARAVVGARGTMEQNKTRVQSQTENVKGINRELDSAQRRLEKSNAILKQERGN